MEFYIRITEDLESKIKIIRQDFFENKLRVIHGSTNFDFLKEKNEEIKNKEKENLKNRKEIIISKENQENLNILPFIVQFALENYKLKSLNVKYSYYLPIISNLLFHLSSEQINTLEDLQTIKNILSIFLLST